MKRKILLIDDEELVIKSVGRLLAKEGFEVIHCRSGEEAVKAVQTESVDLIICDVRMPKMNGVETLTQIRGLLEKKGPGRVPEILMTGYAEENANRAAEELGVADYIYKPFDIRDFMACVKKNLGG